jgi:hypothetical protein
MLLIRNLNQSEPKPYYIKPTEHNAPGLYPQCVMWIEFLRVSLQIAGTN